MLRDHISKQCSIILLIFWENQHGYSASVWLTQEFKPLCCDLPQKPQGSRVAACMCYATMLIHLYHQQKPSVTIGPTSFRGERGGWRNYIYTPRRPQNIFYRTINGKLFFNGSCRNFILLCSWKKGYRFTSMIYSQQILIPYQNSNK